MSVPHPGGDPNANLYAQVNYPALLRSGLPAPRLLRTGLPVSVSELASDVDTAALGSAGGFHLPVVRSVPLLPGGHSATTDSARFLSRLNTVSRVVSIVLRYSSAGVVTVAQNVQTNDDGAVSPPHPTAFLVRWRGLRYSLRVEA